MKRKIILPFLVLISFCASAQMEIDKMEKLLLDKKDSLGIASYKWLINVSGDFYENSNSISNSFIRPLAYNRSFIDEATKDKQSKRIKKMNRAGADAYASINGIYNAKKITYVFGIGHREFAAARFSDDLFNLVFYGNASFAGENANLNKTSIKYFDYQNIYFGVQKQLKEGKITVGATASFIRGGRYQSITMDKMSLYTEPTGDYIDFNGDINYSKSTRKKLGTSNGKGASINLLFSLKQNKNRLNVEVRDLGFISWKDVKTYSGNSNYQYNGLIVDDVLSPGSSVVSNITIDSVANTVGLSVKTKNLTMFLPSTFHINYVISPNRKFSRTIGMRYMLIPGYVPRVYLREADFLGKGFTLINTFSYGGFGRLDYEIGMMKKFKDSFIISVNLFAFEYLVLPAHSSGNGLNFGLTKLF